MTANFRVAIHDEVVREQLGKVRLLYPELYAFLVDRERRIHSALVRSPDPSDPEWMSSSGELEQLVGQLKSIQKRDGAVISEFDRGLHV